MGWTVDWKVYINGFDRSGDMKSFLMDISTTDKAGLTSDSCSLKFDDEAGQVRLSRNDETVRVLLEGTQVFDGVISGVRSSGGRGSGHILTMTAKGVDLRGKAKQPQKYHMDDATAGDFLKKAAKLAGFDIDVHPDIASVKRDYWANDRQSFLQLGEHMAKELGGTFKARGKNAVLVPLGFDLGLPTIQGVVGRNVISWDIAPDLGRARFSGGAIDYLDRKTGKIESLETEYDQGPSKAEAIETGRALAVNKDHAQQVAKGRKAQAERKGGSGSATLDITPQAQAEGLFVLSGARAGIDGQYKMTSVTHKASRSSGATTSLQLEQPDGKAGKDGR
ncbi:hypothetical protein SAMN04515647_4371 [Cohaesibacter sp. ES.047]|uniref:phage late control D family protein n=1 Tax=Cohaesibacter sp. ES.047 TaxID=1798205 RepID=UPI000BB8AD2E|nr:late control D family protein [Cohaesibacter sp. ES.047]SNY94046.1 hypothetical protein SAMN04515647_4371 [Cohaesibacter sp. ES.047]